MPTRFFTLISCIAALTVAKAFPAQVAEELEFKNGRRIPVSKITPTPAGFSTTITIGNATQAVNFTANDIVRGTFLEPVALSKARFLTATDKPQEAIVELEKPLQQTAPFLSIRGCWWYRLAILQMDALAARNKIDDALAFADAGKVESLPPELASLVNDYKKIIAKPTATLEEKITDLQSLAKRSSDSWISARAWLEVGNVLSAQGKTEDAVKAWLRVFLFHASEADLATRGLVSAARGLQQLELAEHGVKLLDDYLSEHIGSPYSSTIRAELTKLDPQQVKR